MYRQAWEDACSTGGLGHITSCTIAHALISLYEEQGKHEEADNIYDLIVSAGQQQLDPWTSYVLCLNFHQMTGYI